MFMVGNDLKVGLVTEHIPLKEVASHITRERVELKIRLMELTLKKDFNISKPKIAVLGLNPHAGDEGLLGTEENDIIKPVIQDLRNKGKLVFGPFPADGFFGVAQYTRYDGVLAMYHDQGLIPFKSLAFENGINYTAGLSVIRTSPDHGTAYAIAGKNQADESSMRQAIYLACDIIKHRKEQLVEK
jgi:4-hydroxythreonine-4-phosphate dehydrogenase